METHSGDVVCHSCKTDHGHREARGWSFCPTCGNALVKHRLTATGDAHRDTLVSERLKLRATE